MLTKFIKIVILLGLAMTFQFAQAVVAMNSAEAQGPYSVTLSILNKTGTHLSNVDVCANPANNATCRDHYDIVAKGEKDLYYQDMPAYQGKRTIVLSNGSGDDFCQITIATKSHVPSVEVKSLNESKAHMCLGTGSIHQIKQSMFISIQVDILSKSSYIDPAIIPAFQSSYQYEGSFTATCANDRVVKFDQQQDESGYNHLVKVYPLTLSGNESDQKRFNKEIAQPACELINLLQPNSSVGYLEVENDFFDMNGDDATMVYAIFCHDGDLETARQFGRDSPDYTKWAALPGDYSIQISSADAAIFSNKNAKDTDKAAVFLKKVAEPYCSQKIK